MPGDENWDPAALVRSVLAAVTLMPVGFQNPVIVVDLAGRGARE